MACALAKIPSTAQCYAPYTECVSGVAILTSEGKVYSGGYVESAAFNPSLTPFHAAWAAAVSDHVLPEQCLFPKGKHQRPGYATGSPTAWRWLYGGRLYVPASAKSFLHRTTGLLRKWLLHSWFWPFLGLNPPLLYVEMLMPQHLGASMKPQ
eukprot:1159220-Pelagomonas_calceolata.AAC.12